MIVRLCTAAFLLIWIGSALHAGGVPPTPPARALNSFGDQFDLLVLDEARPARLTLKIDIDGRPGREVWNVAIAGLFAFLDRDKDGLLSKEEAKRLPAPFDLRRMIWGQFHPPTRDNAEWSLADANSDGRLSRDEVAAYYVNGGLGIQIGAGAVFSSVRLNAALLKALDRDADGTLSIAELRNIESSLANLDANEDELISPGEIAKGIAYPGGFGSKRLDQPDATTAWPDERTPWVWLLPDDVRDVRWTSAFLNARAPGKTKGKNADFAPDFLKSLDSDRDGRISDQELAAWRSAPSQHTWPIHWKKDTGLVQIKDRETVVVEASQPGLRCHLRVDAGRLPKLRAAARQGLIDKFLEADVDRDQRVALDDPGVQKNQDLKRLVELADRDGDGKLSRGELDAWQKVQDEIDAGQLLVTVLDHGRSLFEFLDADRDGRLSRRESRVALKRLESEGCLEGDRLTHDRLPRTVRLVVSKGHPNEFFALVPSRGPDWFRAMDRNSDGDVSLREFVGPMTRFREMDTDNDGLISPMEAEKHAANKATGGANKSR